MIAVTYHSDLKEVQSNARLASFLDEREQSSPFDRLAWWQGLQTYCGLHPMIAVACEGDAVAVLPLARGAEGLELLTSWYTFRARPLVSAGADTPALLAAIADDLSARAGRVVLTGLPDEDGSASLVRAAFRKAGWLVLSSVCDRNHILNVDGRSYADYLAARPGQLRTTLKRKAAKVECVIHSRFDPEAWDAYEAIYAESWKPSEGSPAFLREFAEAEGRAGRLRLGIAYGKLDADAEREAIAAQLWTVEGGTAFIHKLAHREKAKPLSPGTVLSAALFEQAIDCDRVRIVDFGTGDDGYKRDWMEEVRPRYRLAMYRPARPANWPAIAKIGAKAGLDRLAARARRS